MSFFKSLGEETLVKLVALMLVGGLDIWLQFLLHHRQQHRSSPGSLRQASSRTGRHDQLHRIYQRRQRPTSRRGPTARKVEKSRRPMRRRPARRGPGTRHG
ncbi:hypothetical protein HUT16_17700 [Kitasatospora sp. NA04385]|uniref:hypothetical protein n=1 Tax=Kitasatospora sp. NA04385 TaxID=2742135 RepID=UPI001590AA13|nr:hypothetical protein [Kitasatospora sp. NA04385]QKW20659.1 hypothetical protein HUT16_17700 [Kitasatospora sp. NA04385]